MIVHYFILECGLFEAGILSNTIVYSKSKIIMV